MASKRKEDVNGYMRVEGNPLSKVGVFPYLGKTISAECEPNQIYFVYRSQEELSKKECIDSFKNIPWVNEHTMLGKKSEGLTPAEKKGVHGVIGENVYFESPYLKGNLISFSESLRDIINDGKNELSCGYRCDYKRKRGSFEGQDYDFIQTDIRGNHLATVEEGRMGPDVAVMDNKFTFDCKDLIMDPKKEGQDKAVALDEATTKVIMDGLASIVKDALPAVVKDMMEDMKKDGKDEDLPDDKKDMSKDEDKDKNKMSKDKDMDKDKCMDKDKEKGKGMDASDFASILSDALKPMKEDIANLKGSAMDSKSVILEMNKRDDLVKQVTPFIGVFDHSDKTLAEVEKYACDKLDLKPAEGMESAILAGYLHGRQPTKSYQVTHGMDSANAGVSPVDSFINGEDK